MLLPIDRKRLVAAFPRRPRDSHKGLCGSVAVIGGAPGMVGAALLAGRTALKLGAGVVHVGLLAEDAPAIDPVQPELMLHKAAEALHQPGITVLAVGCGLGQSKAALQLLHEALKKDVPLVLDADALNLLAQHAGLLAQMKARKAATMLTPHPGEAARLLGCASAEVQADRAAAVQELAQRYPAAIVLKGAGSLCMTRSGELYLNDTGNPGMSSAGMGDVLTGMVAAFLAHGLSADDALLLAVHLHGAAGDELARQGITIGMTATEVTERARKLLNAWLSA